MHFLFQQQQPFGIEFVCKLKVKRDKEAQRAVICELFTSVAFAL